MILFQRLLFDNIRRPAYKIGMDPESCHFHYSLQAEWLAESRRFLFRKAGIAGRGSILDFGCGSGVITDELRSRGGVDVVGIDRDPRMARLARDKFPHTRFEIGSEETLLSEKRTFDLIVFSFVLMWQRNPASFLKKIKKLLKPGGKLLFLAEPDYGGRIDTPDGLAGLRDFYGGCIRAEGGDPFVGRKLHHLLTAAGFVAQVGVFNHLSFIGSYDRKTWEREWGFWEELSRTDTRALRKLEWAAIRKGERAVLFPLFYAVAGIIGPREPKRLPHEPGAKERTG